MTTSIAQKVNERNAARQIKFGSPKLRDLLRQVSQNWIQIFTVPSATQMKGVLFVHPK